MIMPNSMYQKEFVRIDPALRLKLTLLSKI